jgi:hypothetical protein
MKKLVPVKRELVPEWCRHLSPAGWFPEGISQ